MCRVKKGVRERIEEGMLQWFGHVERMENDKIANRVYVGECAGSRSVSRVQKRWIDTMKECLRKRCLDGKQEEWWGFVRGNAYGVPQGINPRH